MATAVEPQKGTVEARGLRFHYVAWGEPGAPAVVLLHGLSAMCRIWDHFAREYQDRYQIFAPDQRGHGDTSWPVEPEYSTDDYVGDLEALVEAWGLRRFALAGLSMGGMNAMAYAARHPSRVSHLVPVDIRPSLDREKRPNLALDQHIAGQGHPTFDDLETAYRLRKGGHPNTPDECVRHHVQYQLKQLPDGKWTFKQDPRVSFHWQPVNLWEELPKIDAPVLIVRGGRSQLVSDSALERMLAAFPNAEAITIAEAGHTVPEDAPRQFNDALGAFLARHPF